MCFDPQVFWSRLRTAFSDCTCQRGLRNGRNTRGSCRIGACSTFHLPYRHLEFVCNASTVLPFQEAVWETLTPTMIQSFYWSCRCRHARRSELAVEMAW